MKDCGSSLKFIVCRCSMCRAVCRMCRQTTLAIGCAPAERAIAQVVAFFIYFFIYFSVDYYFISQKTMVSLGKIADGGFRSSAGLLINRRGLSL